MLSCERCGTRFGRTTAVPGSCPRCLAREGVRVALAFKSLDGAGPRPPARRLPAGLEGAVGERLSAEADRRAPTPTG
jgi:hypothetical protein